MSKDKNKDKKQRAASAEDRPMVSVAAHHRAPGSIARIRSWCSLGAVVLVLALGWGSGMSGSAVASRAILAGLLGYLVGWAVGVGVWRELIKAEVIAAVRRAEARRQR